jgi:hypothetical protein
MAEGASYLTTAPEAAGPQALLYCLAAYSGGCAPAEKHKHPANKRRVLRDNAKNLDRQVSETGSA